MWSLANLLTILLRPWGVLDSLFKKPVGILKKKLSCELEDWETQTNTRFWVVQLFFPDMPCTKRFYIDKKTVFNWSAATNKERLALLIHQL